MFIVKEHNFLPYFHWCDAVQSIIDGHRRPYAQIGDAFIGPGTATLLNRYAYIEQLGYGVKATTIMDDNSKRNLPTIQGGMFFFDSATGTLRSVLESKLITNIKTAADSVCGALFLARPDSRVLLIVGAGNMARSIALAYADQFPKLQKILMWSRRPQQAQNLATELNKWGVALAPVVNLEQACAQADIVSTVTMSYTPVIHGHWIKAGTHIDLIGAYKNMMREADDNLIQKSTVFVDSFKTTINHIGELIIPLKKGIIMRDDIRGDLYDIIAGRAHRQTDKEITLFKNGGGAHLDTMIAAYITHTLENNAD